MQTSSTSAHGKQTLCDVHGTPEEMIDIIPHGIPSAVLGLVSKDRLGLADQRVILTFGLLSPDKGFEYVIDAMPAILREHPTATFVDRAYEERP